jgi:hypothetical protein
VAEFYLRPWGLSSKFSYFGVGDVGVLVGRLGVGPAIVVRAEVGFIKRTRSFSEFARSFSEGECVALLLGWDVNDQ